MPRGAMSRTVLITVCLVVALFAASPATAATHTLTCSNTIEGDLRATINDVAASGDTIVLPANCVIHLTGAANDDANLTGDIDISANTAATTLTFTGGGVGSTIIDGGGNDRIFDINTGKTVIIQNMTLRNGDGTKSTGTKDGGCIFHGGTALTLTNVQITGCKGASGGGVFDAGGAMTMTNVAITGNTATADGGGLQADLTQDTLTNVTISGNHANGGGGGIHHNNGPMTLQNVTIANNTAGAAGGGGIFIEAGGAPTGKNLIMTGNTATGGGDPNCHGTFLAATNTMTNDKTGCNPTLSFTVVNNVNLQPLANSSGGDLTKLTLTHAILSDSPAVNAGGASGCPAADQRGAARASCDIGAFEMTQPNLAVSVNQTSYKAGDTLTVSGSAGGGPQVVDVYVALIVPASAGLCPGELTLAFLLPGNSFALVCGVDAPATFPKFIGSFSVPAAPIAGTVFSLPGLAAPSGTYNAIIAFTTPGAFAGNTLSGIVSQATAAFIVE
jgi:hypothetical protein